MVLLASLFGDESFKGLLEEGFVATTSRPD